MSSNKTSVDGDHTELSRKLRALQEDNERLRQQLDQVEREKVEYLQNVSHQLVAPLNAIKWHIENLKEGRLDIDRIRKVLRSVYSQATLAVHLAKNFNLMSNLEADHSLAALKEPLQDVELCRLLINLADDFQPLAWDRDIQIEVNKDRFETAPSVLAMKPLISQVFSNIIENAVKYSNSHTMILVEGRYESSSDRVAVTVRNQGIRLDRQDCTRVFERGFRSPEAKNKYPAGSGFGLYIAKRIVDLHEGSLKAGTGADGWITFTVELSVQGLKGRARRRDEKERTFN
jgi:signal transduction histidine kinase